MVYGLVGLAGNALDSLFAQVQGFIPGLVFFLAILAVFSLVYWVLTTVLKGTLKRTVKKKEQARYVLGIWRYVYLFFALVTLVLIFSGSLAATGISIGLLSAGLGWALQKPITGIAGWLMVLVTRPFKLGDRILFGNIKGDVSKITMFYIIINEVGGTIGGEEKSGRGILIPTSTLFDQKIINYSFKDEFIMDEVTADYTFQSNLEKIEKIVTQAAYNSIKHYGDKLPGKPFSRVFFNPNGLRVKVRYFVAARDRTTVGTEIARKIHSSIMAEKDTQFAYPHTELAFRSDNPLKLVQGK